MLGIEGEADDEDEMVVSAVDGAEAKEERAFDASEEAVVPKQLRRPDQPSQKGD